ncbi:alpha/beta hydrolase [Actinomadura meridiana]|uniref:Alpha/beta hydrolase n=1 Tax=Actinomadura meridiana TaxID=559626 RepID=A0ABP8CK69_9ACTN
MAKLNRPTTVTELSCGPVEYRLERHGPRTVLILHGGHVRASLPLGEEVFVANGYSVLVPSRPGYGDTPLTTGTSPTVFSDVVAELCGKLGIPRLVAAVGQSAGGPTAVTLASRHPDLVERLILQSAVGFLSWPDRRIRLGGGLVFSAHAEKATWIAIHALVRRAPRTALRLLLRDLTTRPVGPMIDNLTAEQRSLLLDLFATMRSGAGFATDLKNMADGDRPVPAVTQPTMIIATPDDGAVPYAHAQALAAALPDARLITSRAPSHFIWLGDDYPAIAVAMAEFLIS